jgi:hypothetical protein
MMPIMAVTADETILPLLVFAYPMIMGLESIARLIQKLEASLEKPEKLPNGQELKSEDLDLIERPSTRIERPAPR